MECPVCFEIYQTPLLLPGCGHTICSACAQLLLTEGNFLRCPECRLVYQLRKGIQSLPRNVALQRTIDEHSQGVTKCGAMCEEHPDDTASLYCKTCEKSICLKCYFCNTLRRGGKTTHSGHQVDTSEDIFSKEKRLLEERVKDYEGRVHKENEYIDKLDDAELKLKTVLDEKLALIEKNKNEIIAKVKQTAGKLKFTLKGSVARDLELLQMAQSSSRDRVTIMSDTLEKANHVLKRANSDNPEINNIKEARQQVESLPESSDADHCSSDSFLKVAQFDTELEGCLHDPKKALAYQIDTPRTPTVKEEDAIVSDTTIYLEIRYNETVRVNKISVYFKEALYKGLSEKQWADTEVTDIRAGVGRLIMKNLQRGTMYRLYAVSSNDFGESAPSNEFWFRTVDAEIEKRVT